MAVCAPLFLFLGCSGLSGPAPPGPASGPSLRSWAAGPVGWLLLPRERKQLRRIDSSTAAIAFIEDFWQRRDPDIATPGNPARTTFEERVAAADQIYPEPGKRGSLTDRGGALILLGSPSHLHVSSRPVLDWDPRARRGRRVKSKRQEYEVWGYRLEELPPLLTESLRGRRGAEPLRLQLTFVRGEERTRLVEGAELLGLAARALAGERPES